MKKINLLLLAGIVTLFVSCASIPDGYEKIEDAPTMYEKYDEFKDVSFIENEEMFYSRVSKVYIGKKDNNYWMRITFRYSGDSWIFFTTATFVNKENERVIFNISPWERKDNIHDGSVSEYVDMLLSDEKAAQLLQVINGHNVKLRLSGDKYTDYDIDDEDYVEGIKTTLEYYFAQKSK